MSKTIFRDLLNKLANEGGRWRSKELTGFAPLTGKLFDHGLLVVGRAVNGWASGWKADDLLDVAVQDRIVDELYPVRSDSHKCPMSWVSDIWGAKDGNYNTARSAFWRVSHEVIKCLEGTKYDSATWVSKMAYSNLYRVSPYGGGNPSNALADVQLLHCRELLRTEINEVKPQSILFLTGLGWAQWFLPNIGFVEDENRSSDCEASGFINDARVAVLPHPQGKNEATIVQAAVKVFTAQAR